MINKYIHVAIAILHQQNKFLLQLRDDIPGIIYPGHWGLFGGHLELDETPDIAVKRELLEEIGYIPPLLSKFDCYTDTKRVRHVYHAPLMVEINQLVLGEGWDMDLLTAEQIRQGEHYSKKAGQVRPLAPPTQRILLDFIDRVVTVSS